jgi:hypothetical protein
LVSKQWQQHATVQPSHTRLTLGCPPGEAWSGGQDAWCRGKHGLHCMVCRVLSLGFSIRALRVRCSSHVLASNHAFCSLRVRTVVHCVKIARVRPSCVRLSGTTIPKACERERVANMPQRSPIRAIFQSKHRRRTIARACDCWALFFVLALVQIMVRMRQHHHLAPGP